MNKNVTKQGTLLKREKICMIFIWDIFTIDPRAQIVVPLSPKYNVTPMLGLCHGVFTDQLIFKRNLGHLFPRK